MFNSLFAQTVMPIPSTWSTGKSEKCDFGSCTLELKSNRTFIRKWDINSIDYGRYLISKDTLELHQTHIRDYYGYATYGFDSSYLPHKSISRYIIKADSLIVFFLGVYVGKRLDTIISEPDRTCSLILNKSKAIK
jgi:hypothetical protein